MYMKVFVFLIVLVAVAVGLGTPVGLGTQLPREMLMKVIIFREFFDAALPVLAFGALIKYLCTCCFKCDDCHKKCEEKPVKNA